MDCTFPIQAARLGARLRHPAAAPALSCSASAESDVPDVPNSDEPYDYRFTKWMVKNKVNGSGPFCCPGWVCAHSAHPSSWLGAWSSPTRAQQAAGQPQSRNLSSTCFLFPGPCCHPTLRFLQRGPQEQLHQFHPVLLCKGEIGDSTKEGKVGSSNQGWFNERNAKKKGRIGAPPWHPSWNKQSCRHMS